MKVHQIEGFTEESRTRDLEKYHDEVGRLWDAVAGKQGIYSLPARMWDSKIIGGPDASAGQAGITPTWEFVNNRSQAIITNFKIGDTLDIVNVPPIVRVYYTISVDGGGGDDLDHQIETKYISDGDSVLSGVSETLVNTTDISALVAGEVASTDFILDKSQIAKGDFISIAYTRLGSADTYSDTSWFILAEFIYQNVSVE